MLKGNNKIDGNKVFIDLFRIYEEELLTIFQYVAPINNTCNIKNSEGKKCECLCNINLNVSGNKIHELHLRVCAECENLMKKIAIKLFPKRDFDKEYKDKNIKKFEKIIKKLPVEDAKKIKESLYKYADMPFYFNILDEKLGLCSKKIEFYKNIETSSEEKIIYIQPFEKNNKQKFLPIWWDNYNIIKHNKIENYTSCTLQDLINSLGGYYILLNYLILNLEVPVTNDEEIQSKIYKPTIGWAEYPTELLVNYGYYRENDAKFLKNIYIGNQKVISGYYDDKTMKMIQERIDKAHEKLHLIDIKTKNSLNNENYLFYNSLNQQKVIVVPGFIYNGVINQSGWALKMEKRFNVCNNI